MLLHPTKVSIIEDLAEHGEASPSEISERMGEPLGNVSYHVTGLVRERWLELAREAPVRGAVEHFYRLAPACRADVLKAAALSSRLARTRF